MMRFANNLLMAVGAVVLAAILLSVMAPKAVHAVTATMVEVVNTTTEPVPTADVNKSVAHNVNVFCNSSTGLCLLVPPSGIVDKSKSWTVPSGMNFVVTDIELATDGTGSVITTFFELKWTPPGGDLVEEGWEVLDNGATTEYQFQNGPVILAGSTVGGIFGTGLNYAAIRGYLTPN
jgi:hypothetical protein